ncbi:hypothetical protein KQI38_00285 [Tissierella carlieri]|uniref:hypothetical protein n=1 Tax=Tissierella carlieri TaxID=689904 RepID=UPI001C10CF24|nr:hypothetical protein [Tissierella carlieri]MBU5310453.1 hypothetical protein [Tissierella carlieri]
MRKIRKKISVFIISICIGTALSSIDVSAASLDTVQTKAQFSTVVQITKNPQSDHLITPFSDIIGWRYKSVNGKVYRRQYNYSKGKWIGEWEAC